MRCGLRRWVLQPLLLGVMFFCRSCFFLSFFFFLQVALAYSGDLVDLEGDVEIAPSGIEYDLVPIFKPTKISNGLFIATGQNSRVLLRLRGGSQIEFLSNTRFQLQFYKEKSATDLKQRRFDFQARLLHGVLMVRSGMEMDQFQLTLGGVDVREINDGCFSAFYDSRSGKIQVKAADKPLQIQEGFLPQILPANKIFRREEQSLSYSYQEIVDPLFYLEQKFDLLSEGMWSLKLQLRDFHTHLDVAKSLPVFINQPNSIFEQNLVRLDASGSVFLETPNPKRIVAIHNQRSGFFWPLF